MSGGGRYLVAYRGVEVVVERNRCNFEILKRNEGGDGEACEERWSIGPGRA